MLKRSGHAVQTSVLTGQLCFNQGPYVLDNEFPRPFWPPLSGVPPELAVRVRPRGARLAPRREAIFRAQRPRKWSKI